MPEIVNEGEAEPVVVETPGEDKTFNQADVDRIVQERLARQKSQFKDYDELKAAAEKLEKIEAANKTELEQAQERAAKAELQATEATERAQRLLTEAAITSVATGKLTDPTDALALIDKGAIEYGEDGKPSNIAALVDALVETKPHLAAGAVSAPKSVDLGARGAVKGATLDDAMALGDSDFLKAIGASTAL